MLSWTFFLFGGKKRIPLFCSLFFLFLPNYVRWSLAGDLSAPFEAPFSQYRKTAIFFPLEGHFFDNNITRLPFPDLIPLFPLLRKDVSEQIFFFPPGIVI